MMNPSRKQFLHSGLGLTAASALPSIFTRREKSTRERLREARREMDREWIGKSRKDLPTPSLILDLEGFEHNLNKMARHARENGVDLRPHAKMHKSPQVARKLMEAGAIGACAATINEAEMLADAGIDGILITGELVGSNKLRRLVELVRRAPDTMAVVDHVSHADELSRAADSAGVTFQLMMDVDPVGRRTGVQPGEPALQLARYVQTRPGLNLRGVHSYSGASSHVRGFEERKAHSQEVMEAPIQTYNTLRDEGMELEIFSGGSTGTYNIDTEIDGFTELQVGSYLFMDIDYKIIGGQSGPVYDDFHQALRVLGTVVSKNHDDRATIDAGIKSFAADRSFGPELVGVDGVNYGFGGDEHGILSFDDPSRQIRRGDKIELYVPHCDPNVNLYSRLFAMRGDTVEDVWEIAGKHL
ncbi:MAG: DSD1 family PLP-dependent enzyme [Bacteroidota bacterium]